MPTQGPPRALLVLVDYANVRRPLTHHLGGDKDIDQFFLDLPASLRALHGDQYDSYIFRFYRPDSAFWPGSGHRALEEAGYTLVTKHPDWIRASQSKTNLDVPLATDLVAAAHEQGAALDILLLSGDGDFAYPIEHALNRGCRVTVVTGQAEAARGYMAATHGHSNLGVLFIEDLYPKHRQAA